MNPAISDPVVLASVIRQLFGQQLDPQVHQSSSEQDSSSLPPSSLSDPALDARPSSPHSLLLEQINALKERVAQLEESANNADDEGDGGMVARRNLMKGILIGGEYRNLSEEQKLARIELTRRVRQIMKALTERAEHSGDVDCDTTVADVPEGELGFIPDYHQPPKFIENAELIKRTVELVLSGYEVDEDTGHHVCSEVHFSKADVYQLATTTFTNKKRQYLMELNAAKKKNNERAKRKNRRHLRQRQTKQHREKQVKAYHEKYGGDLPKELFQSDYMTTLISELDSTDVPSAPDDDDDDDDDDEGDDNDNEDNRALRKRARLVKTARTLRFLELARLAGLTAREMQEKVKVWEEKKPAFRSNEVSKIYQRLDKLENEEREQKSRSSRLWSRRVCIGNTECKIPKCKRLVWPFMVDNAWLEDDDDHKKARWTKLQRSDPEGLDLGLNSD